MKKFTFFVILFLVINKLCLAQTSTEVKIDITTIPSSAQLATIEHVVISISNLDFYDVNFGGTKNRLMGSDGISYRFKSAFDALLFMNSLGWEYVSTFTDTVLIDGHTSQVILIRKKL